MFSSKSLIAFTSTVAVASTIVSAADPSFVGKWTRISMTPEACDNPETPEIICPYLCSDEGEWTLTEDKYTWTETVDPAQFGVKDCKCGITGAVKDGKLELIANDAVLGTMEVKDGKPTLSFKASDSLTCVATYAKTVVPSFEGEWKREAVDSKTCEAPEDCIYQCAAEGTWAKDGDKLKWTAAKEPTAENCKCELSGEPQGSRLALKAGDTTVGVMLVGSEKKPELVYAGAEELCVATYAAAKASDDTKNTTTPAPSPTPSPSSTASVLSAAGASIVVALTALAL